MWVTKRVQIKAKKHKPKRPALSRVRRKSSRRRYIPYIPLFQRVHWYNGSIDNTNEHCPVRLFGFYRAKRLWVLMETTGLALSRLKTKSRDGIDVQWLPSRRMRAYLYMLSNASRNPTTKRFVDDCIATMDRINRVKLRDRGDSVDIN